MIEPCHRFDADWELLVLGALDAERTAQMRAHASGGCGHCQDRLHEARGLVGSIGASLEPEAPPPHVEASLVQRLHALEADAAVRPRALPSPSSAPVRAASSAGRERIVRLAAIAALVVCAVLVWQQLGLRRELAAVRARVERGAASRPASGQAEPARPAADPRNAPAAQPAAPADPVGDAARDIARERDRMAAALAQADAARARAEADAARWRDELARLERTLASSAPPAATVPAPPAAAAPAPRNEDLREEVGRLAADIRRLEAQARRETSRASAYASALQVALDPGSRRVALRAVDRAAGGATASALLGSDGRLVLTTKALPTLAADKCYQLWIIRRDNPAVVSGGVLNDVASGQVVHLARVEGRPDLVTGFAITDEPAGGSESSRGRKLLFGAMP